MFENAIDMSDVPQDQWRQYVGKGYRSCVYTTGPDRHAVIVLMGFDSAGNPKDYIFPHTCKVKYRVKYPTAEKDIFGNYVATKEFANSYLRKRWLENAKGIWVVEAMRPEQEFLQDMFWKECRDDDFNKQPVRTHYFDIETEISDKGFERPVSAGCRINMMTVYDTLTEKFYTWSLQPAVAEFHDELDESGNVIWENPLKAYPKDKFEIFCFNDDEDAMLRHFLDWNEKNRADVNFTWNGQAFDMPYLYRRIENVLGKDEADRLSPMPGGCRIKEVNHDNERANVQAEIELDVKGLFIADGLVLYRDKFKIAGSSLDGGYSLDNVGEHEGCGHKIKYKGTLKDLYQKDWQKFYEYNVRDVDLTMKIETKLNMAPRARAITSAGLCNCASIYSSVGYLVGSLTAFSKFLTGDVMQSYLNEEKPAESYEGAFVFEPIKGLYRNGIKVVDFNSLYPSTIRSVNLSPETYVGKLTAIKAVEDNEPIDLSDESIVKFRFKPANDGPVKIVSREEILKLVDEKCIFTRNNTLFLKHSVKQGVVSAWCKHFYGLRKQTKKAMQKLELALYNNEVPAEKVAEVKVQIQNLDANQQAIKIMINSIYGIHGTRFSPLYNIDLAQTITRVGKFCNISSSKYIAKVFNERYGTKYAIMREGQPQYVISGDTDSLFVSMAPMVAKMREDKGLDENISKWSDEDKLALWKEANGFVEDELNPYVQGLMRDVCRTEHPEVLRYSLEYIADTGIYEAKKHYAVHKILSEGPEIVDKIKYSGIELKKGSVPVKVKEFLGEIYKNTLCSGWQEKDFRAYINDVYDRFCKLTVQDLAIWKGYNTERQSTGFLTMEKGATGISKACSYYNSMISKQGLNISDKYESIIVGDKVRFVYICPNNAYGINCMAFKDGQWPKEFDQVFKVDYSVMFEKCVLSPLKGYIEATRFQSSDPRNQQEYDIDAL